MKYFLKSLSVLLLVLSLLSGSCFADSWKNTAKDMNAEVQEKLKTPPDFRPTPKHMYTLPSVHHSSPLLHNTSTRRSSTEREFEALYSAQKTRRLLEEKKIELFRKIEQDARGRLRSP